MQIKKSFFLIPILSFSMDRLCSEVSFSVSKPFVSDTKLLVVASIKIFEAEMDEVSFEVEAGDVIGFDGKAVVKLSDVKSI